MIVNDILMNLGEIIHTVCIFFFFLLRGIIRPLNGENDEIFVRLEDVDDYDL